jgi:uncharacterized membrane protein
VNVVLAAFVSVAVLVPGIFALGWNGLGWSILNTDRLACEQIPTHSYYVFGYQLALYAGNLAIYSSLLVGSVAFRFLRAKVPVPDWRLWLLTPLLIVLGGVLPLFGLRGSTLELRALTGAIFGLGACWFVLPVIDAAARGDLARARIALDFRFLGGLVPRRGAGG